MASLLDHHQELNFQDLPGMITRVFNIYEPLIIRWSKGLMRFFFPKGIMSVRGGSILKMFLSGFDMFFQVIVCNETGRAQCKREDRSISKDGIFTLFYDWTKMGTNKACSSHPKRLLGASWETQDRNQGATSVVFSFSPMQRHWGDKIGKDGDWANGVGSHEHGL